MTRYTPSGQGKALGMPAGPSLIQDLCWHDKVGQSSCQYPVVKEPSIEKEGGDLKLNMNQQHCLLFDSHILKHFYLKRQIREHCYFTQQFSLFRTAGIRRTPFCGGGTHRGIKPLMGQAAPVCGGPRPAMVGTCFTEMLHMRGNVFRYFKHSACYGTQHCT